MFQIWIGKKHHLIDGLLFANQLNAYENDIDYVLYCDELPKKNMPKIRYVLIKELFQENPTLKFHCDKFLKFHSPYLRSAQSEVIRLWLLCRNNDFYLDSDATLKGPEPSMIHGVPYFASIPTMPPKLDIFAMGGINCQSYFVELWNRWFSNDAHLHPSSSFISHINRLQMLGRDYKFFESDFSHLRMNGRY